MAVNKNNSFVKSVSRELEISILNLQLLIKVDINSNCIHF